MHLSPEQKALYARCSKFFFDLREELEAAVKAGGCTAAEAEQGKGGKGSNVLRVFWSLQMRVFRDFLNSFKCTGQGGIVDMVQQALADGYDALFALLSYSPYLRPTPAHPPMGTCTYLPHTASASSSGSRARARRA